MTTQASPDPLKAELDKLAKKIRSAHSALTPVSHIRDASNMRQQLADLMGEVREADELRCNNQLTEARQAMPDAAKVDRLCRRAHNFVALDDSSETDEGSQPASSESKRKTHTSPNKELAESRPQGKRPSTKGSSHSDQSVEDVIIAILESHGTSLEGVAAAGRAADWVKDRRNTLRRDRHQRTH